MDHKKIYIYGAMLAGILTSCTDKVDMPVEFLDGHSKTPIAIQTNLSAAPVTRAFDKTFEKDDELIAYIEAGVTTSDVFSSEGNPFKGLKTFTLTADADNKDGDNHADLYGYTITKESDPHITETDVTNHKLYWDNYSSTEYDLRKEGAGIRLKYGYCYNGGTPVTDSFNEETGTLTWTVQSDQKASDGSAMKHSDLLFAKTQKPVSYIHGAAEDSKHGVLVLPYSHAMSKITINVTTGEGFSAETANFEYSVLTLHHMQTKAAVDAPNGFVNANDEGKLDEPTGDASVISDIKTYTASKANTTATYQAIVAPGTNLSVINLLASITNVDNNNYDIPVTTGILNAWSGKLEESEEYIYDGVAQAKPLTRATIEEGKGYLTEPGVHYILNVILDKQKITIRATLADWDQIKAESKAKINFTPDVQTEGSIAEALQAKGFDVYKSSSASDFSQKSTTLTYATGKWTYDPVIYWAGQSDNSYFRALSPAGSSTSALSQGTDYMWGTSKKGTGDEVAITPRTGDVPLYFDHAMSKITMNLITSSDAAAAVDLTDATISISNLATTGKIDLKDGNITPDAAQTEGIPATTAPITDYCVIPQTLAGSEIVTITLKDGTTYKVTLKECVQTGTTTPVTQWLRGKHYTYTIYLEKEKITFSAEVKEWLEQSASGNATLDWD